MLQFCHGTSHSTRSVLDQAAIARSEGEAQSEAGSCHQQDLIVQQIDLHILSPTHSAEDYSKGLSGLVLELKVLELHLMMAVKEVCTYDFEGDFDELLRDVKIENSSDAAICAVEALTTQEIVLDAEVMEGNEGEAQSKARVMNQASSFTKIYAYAVNISDCLSSEMANTCLLKRNCNGSTFKTEDRDYY